jgi:hypothetical protein
VRHHADHDALFTRLVVASNVDAVFLIDSTNEDAVNVGAHLGVASNLQITHGIGEVKDKQAARGSLQEILGLLTSGVQRNRNRVIVRDEPDGRKLRSTIGTYRGKRRDGTLKQVTVGLGNGAHGRLFLMADID